MSGLLVLSSPLWLINDESILRWSLAFDSHTVDTYPNVPQGRSIDRLCRCCVGGLWSECWYLAFRSQRLPYIFRWNFLRWPLCPSHRQWKTDRDHGCFTSWRHTQLWFESAMRSARIRRRRILVNDNILCTTMFTLYCSHSRPTATQIWWSQ